MAGLSRLIADLARRLGKMSDSAYLDVQVAAAEVLDVSRSWILAHPEHELYSFQEDVLREIGRRLEAGEPLPYILGHWEFYGLDFNVSPDVLIPRPETELLVEQALEWLKEQRESGRLALDVGTGSGCIAVTLAFNEPGLSVIASDIAHSATRTARTNAVRHHVASRVWCVQADLLPSLGQPLSLVCANLPYIDSQTLAGLDVSKWEPSLALDGGVDGLQLISRLLTSLSTGSTGAGEDPAGQMNILAPCALLLFEIEATQGSSVLHLAQVAFPNADIRLLKDLTGHDRLLRIELQENATR